MNVDYPIIDADGHVLEKDRELHDYLEGRYAKAPRFETYSYFPSLDGWNRGTGVPGKNPEWACVLARAYNSWISDRFTTQSPRLQAVALLPVHEPFEAAKEIERAK